MVVKFALAPEHIGEVFKNTATVGITLAFTTMEMLLDVTIAVDKQLALLVSTQVTTSALVKVEEANIELFVPALIPFIFHW